MKILSCENRVNIAITQKIKILSKTGKNIGKHKQISDTWKTSNFQNMKNIKISI